jgi:site-specific recombinase XerD
MFVSMRLPSLRSRCCRSDRSPAEGKFLLTYKGSLYRDTNTGLIRQHEEAGLRDFTWYCLRHMFASRLAMAGVDLLTISELMGHKTIQMTKRYAHLAPAHNQAAVDRLVSFQSPREAEPVPAEPSATPSATGSETLEEAESAVVH